MRHPVFEARMRPLDRSRERDFGVCARLAESRQLARDACRIVFGHRMVELRKSPLDAERFWRVTESDPAGTRFPLDRIDAQIVAAVDRRTALEIEFPVVQVTAQNALQIEPDVHQR